MAIAVISVLNGTYITSCSMSADTAYTQATTEWGVKSGTARHPTTECPHCHVALVLLLNQAAENTLSMDIQEVDMCYDV